MANLSISGFRVAYHMSGGDVTFERVQALSNNTTAIFKGDCVTPAATALWDLSTAGAGNAIGSIAWGVEYRDAQKRIVRRKYLPASTVYTESDGDDGCNYLFIAKDVVNVVFTNQVNAAILQTDLNNNYAFAAGSGGSTATGWSSHVLDSAGHGTGATLQFRAFAFVRGGGPAAAPLNDRTLTNAKVYCQVNNHLGRHAALNTTGA